MRLSLLLIACSLSCLATASPPPVVPEVVVLAYDSFAAKGGLGPELAPLFEKQCGCRLRILPSGDAGQLLARLRLDADRGKSPATVAIGIDDRLWPEARAYAEPWGEWRPQGYDRLEADSLVEPGFVPFDRGAFAWIVDREELKKKNLPLPTKLDDLLAPGWKRNLLLEDPRTSSPGLAFASYVRAVKGAGAQAYFRALRSQWLTLAPGWDAAYGLFLKRQAPLVWSYVTSQAYHEEHDGKGRYAAVLFDEGQPSQIEGAILLKDGITTPEQRVLARRFVEFLISPEAQARVPGKNWMHPVRADVRLPPSFVRLPKPTKLVRPPGSAEATKETLAVFARGVSEP